MPRCDHKLIHLDLTGQCVHWSNKALESASVHTTDGTVCIRTLISSLFLPMPRKTRGDCSPSTHPKSSSVRRRCCIFSWVSTTSFSDTPKRALSACKSVDPGKREALPFTAMLSSSLPPPPLLLPLLLVLVLSSLATLALVERDILRDDNWQSLSSLLLGREATGETYMYVHKHRDRMNLIYSPQTCSHHKSCYQLVYFEQFFC